MATYVADGNNEYIAELSGAFTTDEANKVLTFGSDGQGDTLFTLPSDSEWLLIEVYDVENEYGDIGYHRYTTNVSNIMDYLIAARAIAVTEYTFCKITAIHYKGNNTCDVYSGDESNALTLYNEDISFTPPVVSWKLSTNLITPLHQKLVCADSYDCDMDWVCDP